MSQQNDYIQEFTEELKIYALYLDEAGYEHELAFSSSDNMPVLSVMLEDDGDSDLPLSLHYMFVEPDDEDDDDEDDVFGHTRYFQALAAFPAALSDEDKLLDLFLFCSAVNQQIPLGMVFLSAEKMLVFRHVFAVDKEVGLTREVFLETLYVINFLVEQINGAVLPLANGECTLDEAVERYMVPA